MSLGGGSGSGGGGGRGGGGGHCKCECGIMSPGLMSCWADVMDVLRLGRCCRCYETGQMLQNWEDVRYETGKMLRDWEDVTRLGRCFETGKMYVTRLGRCYETGQMLRDWVGQHFSGLQLEMVQRGQCSELVQTLDKRTLG